MSKAVYELVDAPASVNIKRIYLFFWLIVAAVIMSAGGDGARAQQRFRFDRWTTDDGLPQNTVNSIAQTSDGYLWLTTFDGLARFDGARFTVFNKSNAANFPSNRLLKMVVDGENNLWFLNDVGSLTKF